MKKGILLPIPEPKQSDSGLSSGTATPTYSISRRSSISSSTKSECAVVHDVREQNHWSYRQATFDDILQYEPQSNEIEHPSSTATSKIDTSVSLACNTKGKMSSLQNRTDETRPKCSFSRQSTTRFKRTRKAINKNRRKSLATRYKVCLIFCSYYYGIHKV